MVSLGKIQLSYGYVEINAWEALKFADDPHQVLQKIAYHYAMAESYFNLFSTAKSNSENIYRNLYLNLKKLKFDELDYLKLIWVKKIPEIVPSVELQSSVLIETALKPALEN